MEFDMIQQETYFNHSFKASGSFDSDSPLCEAAWNGDSLSVSHLADSETVNQISSSGFSSLQYAAARGDLEVVNILVEAGACVDQEDKDGWTSLMWAIWGHHLNVVNYLVQRGAKLNQPNSNGDTSLHLASQSSQRRPEKYEIIKILILGGGCINLQNLDGETPLHMSVATGDRDLVVLLLTYGAWINAQDYSGETPLHWAIREGNRGIIQTLIASGADVNVQNDDLETPLHLAVGCEGGWDIVEQLLQARARIDLSDDTGSTPLIEAVIGGQTRIVKMLLRRGLTEGAQFITQYVNHRDRSLRTALHYAVEGERSGEMLNDLLAAGAEINVKDEDGRTPMDYSRSQTVVDLLTRRLIALRTSLADKKERDGSMIISGSNVNGGNSTSDRNTPVNFATNTNSNSDVINFTNNPII